jgi:aminopeptidase N
MTPSPIRVQLPDAPTGLYLQWMRYWRRVERKMLENPLLHEIASKASAPFLHDEVARFISSELLVSIERQARRARTQGLPTVAPIIEGEREVLRQAVDYVIRRARWLHDLNVSRRMRIRPLPEEPANLRAKALAVMHLQLANDSSETSGSSGA